LVAIEVVDGQAVAPGEGCRDRSLPGIRRAADPEHAGQGRTQAGEIRHCWRSIRGAGVVQKSNDTWSIKKDPDEPVGSRRLAGEPRTQSVDPKTRCET